MKAKFCTAINCIDGRTQLPVIKYLQKRFKAEYVDSITEPGPNLILAERTKTALVQSILERLKISVEKHDSAGIAVVGHYDCAVNPAPRDEQIKQIQKAIRFLRQHHETPDITGLWVDEKWNVHEINNKASGDHPSALLQSSEQAPLRAGNHGT